MSRGKLWAGTLLVLVSAAAPAQQARPQPATQIVMLGTGSPVADYKHSGPSLAIVVNGTAYVVDCGPNCLRQADAAFQKKGITALQPVKIRHFFLTHLHTDHTLGYPDLILTPWDMGRTEPLLVFGPQGTRAMTNALLKSWKIDIGVRTKGLEGASSTGYEPVVNEIKQGLVYKDANVTVTAFPVLHGSFPHSYGYKFVTPGRTIVVSGDTRPAQTVIENARGADVLVHEVYSMGHFQRSTPEFQKYLEAFHTSSVQLAEIARQARPRLLILTHKLGYLGEPVGSIGDEVRAKYAGEVADAQDLDVF